jgi:hypothetical protein
VNRMKRNALMSASKSLSWPADLIDASIIREWLWTRLRERVEVETVLPGKISKV